MSCVFCEIVAKRAPAQVVRRWSDALAIIPLNPVVEGHVLVIPNRHVVDAAESPETSALAMLRAAQHIANVGPCNIITSIGKEATQSVLHLHIHIVPRKADDGLLLPWSKT